MAKKIVQDVLPPERSIRNIPLSGKARTSSEESRTRARRTSPVSTALNSRTRTSVGSRAVIEEEKIRSSGSGNRRSGTEGGRSRGVVWSLAVVCFVGVVFACSFLFTSATVDVTPKQWTLPVSAQLEASKTGETLSYSLVTVSRESSRSVPASGQQEVQEKASGSITIFNSHSTQPQALVKNTRFETPAGLIFRINEAVTVPGATNRGTTTIPGSITVKVVADKAGPTYNVGLTDFTIPGFKGDAKYKTIIAKSDPSAPLSGGFIGTVGKVKDADLQVAYAALEKELTEALIAQITPQVPAGQIFFPTARVISFEKMPIAPAVASSTSSATTATVKEKAVLTGMLIDQAKLVSLLSNSFPAETTKTPLEIEQWNNLSFAFKAGSESKLMKGEPVQFTLQGDVVARAHVDTGDLGSMLVGQSRSQFGSVLSQAPAIAQAKLKMKPVWAWKLPKNVDKITIKINNPQ